MAITPFDLPQLQSYGRLTFDIVGIGIFYLFCSYDWPNDLSGDIPDVQIWTFYVKASESYRLTDRQTYGQTWLKLYTTSLCGWSAFNNLLICLSVKCSCSILVTALLNQHVIIITIKIVITIIIALFFKSKLCSVGKNGYLGWHIYTTADTETYSQEMST